ncbi:MAG: DUF4956 domain-containing protein [Planctomycetaceae bacterium]
MPDWLPSISEEINITLSTLVTRLSLAWVGGIAIASIARGGIKQTRNDNLSLTLVLMSILIAMATQIIGDNIARAFSLVGALSIVRFRTAVPATRDVAFVLAAVVVGMAVGAGQYGVFLLGLITVALATNLSYWTTSGSRGEHRSFSVDPHIWRLNLQVSLHQSESWDKKLESLTGGCQLVAANTVRGGSALELIYQFLPENDFDAAQLITTLNSLPGVESVSAKQSG